MKKRNNSKEMNTKISAVIHRKDCLPPPLRLRSSYYQPVCSNSLTLKMEIAIPKLVNSYRYSL